MRPSLIKSNAFVQQSSVLIGAFVICIFVIAALAILPGCSNGNKPEDNKSNEVVENVGGTNLREYKYSELHKIEDFALTERSGVEFGSKDLQGKVWIASFFFSSCKFECSDQNRTIRDEVHEKLAGIDFTVVSITCDPLTDSVDVLKKYATEFTTMPEKWKFLTGPITDIQAIGDKSFKVVVDPTTHSKRILLVDKWGRFRDSFEWKEPEDLRRLLKVARMLEAEESEPAPDEIVRTRAMPESVFQLNNNPHGHSDATENKKADEKKKTDDKTAERDPNWPAWRNSDWLTSFELKNQNGETFRSDDMKGKVWIANFFFTSCTGACPKLLNGIDELKKQLGDRDVTFVSISNDPDRDTPKILKEYSHKFDAKNDWHFLTGDEQLQIRAIGSEFFDVNAGSGETHSEKLTVVDKWGKVRGHFSYNKTDEMTDLRLLLDELLAEKEPPKK